MRRVAAVTALVVGLLWCGAGAALAEAPLRVDDPVTDKTAALGAGPSQVQTALERLDADTDLRLYVVYVSTFSGRGGQDWADQTAQMSQLGRNDVLLAIATADRAYGISVDDRFPVSDSVVTAIEDRDVRPKLTAGDLPGAAVALADGLRTGGPAAGADDGSGGVPVAALVGGAAVVGGAGYLLVRRRRAAAAASSAAAGPDPEPSTPDPAPGEKTPDLAYRASAALIELDDSVQTSEHELGLARMQFGDEAVTDFQAALDSSRAELVQAFALRQRIDDEKPDDAGERDLLGQILTLCTTADERLDAQAAAFDRLRDLEQNAPQVIADLRPELGAVAARLPGTTAALDALRTRYAATAVEPIADNVTQAQARLDIARTEIDEAGTELAAGERPAAAVSARAAEEAIAQAGTLLDGVRRLADELAQAANRLVEARAEVEADLAEAHALPGDDLAAGRRQRRLRAGGRGGELVAGQQARLGEVRLDLGTGLDQPVRGLRQLVREPADPVEQGPGLRDRLLGRAGRHRRGRALPGGQLLARLLDLAAGDVETRRGLGDALVHRLDRGRRVAGAQGVQRRRRAGDAGGHGRELRQIGRAHV